MDCKHIEELLPAYALNALGEEEVSLVEAHLEGCPWCPALLREHLQVSASLSLLAQPSEPPPGLKEKTMRRAGKGLRHRPEPWRPRFSLGGRLALAGATSLAVASLATVIALNVYMTNQLHDLDRENSRLAGQVLSLAGEEQNLRTALLTQMESVEQESSRLAVQLSSLSDEDKKLSDMFMEQRSMNYIMAAPDRQVYSLQANKEARAEGMLMVALKSGTGVLVAKGLQPSSGKRGYYVWLRKDGERIAAGHLSVDETGWGTLTLWPEQPITVFQHIWVTEDDADEAAKPVLWGSIVPR